MASIIGNLQLDRLTRSERVIFQQLVNAGANDMMPYQCPANKIAKITFERLYNQGPNIVGNAAPGTDFTIYHRKNGAPNSDLTLATYDQQIVSGGQLNLVVDYQSFQNNGLYDGDPAIILRDGEQIRFSVATPFPATTISFIFYIEEYEQSV